MLKRVAAAFLWYAMVWVGYEIVWSIAGLPRMIGPIFAASVAMIVVVDPLHLFWSRPEVPGPTSVAVGVPALKANAADSR
jgi:hypothetical protein